MQAPKSEAGMETRNWDKLEGDRAYISHSHTVEVLAHLALEHGFICTQSLHSVGQSEYRSTYTSTQDSSEFSASTVVYPDSSTYTYIHIKVDTSVLVADPTQTFKLSNADIKRAEGRDKRVAEITRALMELGFIPKPIIPEKRVRNDGIVLKKDPGGGYTLDYSGVRNGKIESPKRVLDYSKFNRVGDDKKKTN